MNFQVRDLRLEPTGYYSARVVSGTTSVEVSRRFGSWMTPPDDRNRMREVLPHVAAALQDRVRRLERKRG